MEKQFKIAIFLVLSFLFVGGCSDDPKDTQKDSETGAVEDKIEIFSWWTAPGEIEALQALVDTFQQEYPTVEVVNLSTIEEDGRAAREALDERMANNDPPDTFQLGPRDFQKWVEYDGDANDNRLEPLDDLYEEQGWTTKFPEGVLEVLRYDGHYYAVPVNMHRQNTLFYNKSLVSDPPMTLEEFFTLAETLQADGITPLALSASAGWTLEILFYSVISGSAGMEYHNDFFTGAVDLSDETQAAKLEQTMDDYLRVVSYANADAGELGWDQAAELVHAGKAAMYVHGDWAKGYYISQGWAPGSDFGAVAALGSEGEFIYNVDAFALCKDAPNPENATNFLKVIGSPEAQAAFNIKKGSTPVNPDVDISDWDAVAQDTFNDFQDATILHNVEIHQFTITTDDDTEITLGDKLLELYQETITRDELITWITDNYEAATTN